MEEGWDPEVLVVVEAGLVEPEMVSEVLEEEILLDGVLCRFPGDTMLELYQL
jgi:hypothetical protein